MKTSVGERLLHARSLELAAAHLIGVSASEFPAILTPNESVEARSVCASSEYGWWSSSVEIRV